ncbi:vomeronasal 1 receptor cavPorV1R613 [Cavia porcellus]|uniref:vomeronasal 1 receptor cavPorV1R613 n=1 Tax=Cavia porcellus TaxID=10141 RepID=UPI0001CF73E3|nr:vomeronasal 1 receptor cavPorV1R613 [Cavia porcellus]
MNKNGKFSMFIDIQHVFFFQVTTGVMANTFLLLFHVFIFLLEHKPKPTDLTIGHLALIHIVMLLSAGFITIDIFGFQDLGDRITCKCVIYLHRLMRGLSICTTCLLSVLQAITLSPRACRLAKLKQKSLHRNLYCFLFLWIFNMLINGRFLISPVTTPNVTSHSLMFVTRSCSLLPISSFLKYMSLSLMIFQHILFIGLMALSSGYMVILLYKHKRQSQHLHCTKLSPKVSPEQRATWTILLLMSFFIVMYILDSVIEYTSAMLWNHDPTRHCVHMLFGSGYATVSPFVLIGTERRLIKCFIFTGGKQSKFFLFHDR